MRRLPDTAHTTRPWRIHAIAPEYRVEDVWELPTPGGPGDLSQAVELFAAASTEESDNVLVRFLFALRWRIGALLGWDGEEKAEPPASASLRGRLPADLRDGPRGPEFQALPFRSLYLADDEWAAEIANATMRGVLHLGWVEDAPGSYHAQMAILVAPNGLFGRAYMAAILPFRYLIVYPALGREIARRWRERRVPVATPSR